MQAVAKRILIAGLSHETHTFVPGKTTLAQFRTLRGDELWQADGDASCLAGGLAAARAHGWQVLPAIHMSAQPSGMVADEVIEQWWEAFAETATRESVGGIDGVWLDMHGAMVSESCPDVEGELLRRIRTLPGCKDALIGGVLDLHGNITAQMAAHSNAFVAYRRNPHTDGKAMAEFSVHLLDDLLTGGRTAVTVWERPPLILPPTATGTASAPMALLEARAREIEAAHPEILAVNVFAGFAYADVPDAGMSFTAVTTGDPEAARRELQGLSEIAMAHKQHALPTGLSLDEALDRVQRHTEGPVLIVEPADNIGGGAPGDLTVVLKGLLERGIRNVGAAIADPEAVRELWPLHPGERKRVRIGGKSGVVGAQPLELEVEMISKSDGKFTLEDPHSHMAVGGLHHDMGPTAVVRATSPQGGSATILLNSIKTAPMDLAQWRSQGINPEDFFVINIKAAVAHRQAYDPIAKASYVVNTPGPCANDLRALPFRHVRRPVYPLDEL
ncbi:MAG: M81 family metallopeptidase [Thermoflexales bacterium]|nr:M81 family metallopeptidase [Thermoflexales bacterium]MDW8350701.1 M81 family metallopeptidase [Anaerolineae bacterium]